MRINISLLEGAWLYSIFSISFYCN